MTRFRFGLAGLVCSLAVIGASLAAASPAAATEWNECGPWDGVGTNASVMTCVHMGWGNDPYQVASSARTEGTQNVDVQTCLWISDTTRIGCSGYEYVTPGTRVVFNDGKDYPNNLYCARTWVSNVLIRTECAFGS